MHEAGTPSTPTRNSGITRVPACRACITPEQAERQGIAWLVLSFIFCPCHLPLTLGLLVLVLSGTAAAALLRLHPFIAGMVLTALWVAGTWRGFYLMRWANKQMTIMAAGGGNEERRSEANTPQL